jgi:hypothetical protein
MYLGQYTKNLNTFDMLFGLKLLMKQWFFKRKEFPTKVVYVKNLEPNLHYFIIFHCYHYKKQIEAK